MKGTLFLAGTAAALLLLAGCASDSAPPVGGGTSSDRATASGSATASPVPAPSTTVFGEPGAQASYVRADALLSVSYGPQRTDPDGTVHMRNGRGTATLTSNDPRLTGDEKSTWNTDVWANPDGSVSLIQWGRTVITTADGTWEGRLSGAYNDATGTDLISWWLTGHGGYEGMTLFMWTSQTDAESATGVFEGLIYPGGPPPGF